jgi:menaquinone-9 beta-reductase
VDLDLIIVGGGPAGVSTALFLAAAAPALKGRIAILEKERYPREKICAGAIGARADKLLATIDVHVEVPSVPIHGLSVATLCGARRTRDGEPAAPIGRVVRRVEFDRALADEARARGIAIHDGVRVLGVEIDDSGARLQTSRGEIRARALVGADGVGSIVRRAIGAPRGRFLAQVAEVDTPARADELPRDLLHFDLTDRRLAGYAWDFPTIVSGEALVCRGLYELRLDREGERERDPRAIDLGARLEARIAGLGLSSRGLRIKRFSERGLALHEPFARPSVMLVGEAAGIDPVLGEGIPQAIGYGAAAGAYLARCLTAGDLSFAGWSRALLRSRVGLDLRIRSRLPWLVYGVPRPLVERWLAETTDLAVAGMRYLAGERVPRRRLAGAARDAGRAIFRELTSSRPSSRPRAPST